jgi:hypothetical protein
VIGSGEGTSDGSDGCEVCLEMALGGVGGQEGAAEGCKFEIEAIGGGEDLGDCCEVAFLRSKEIAASKTSSITQDWFGL